MEGILGGKSPAWLREVAGKVNDLIYKYQAIDYFRRMLQRWVEYAHEVDSKYRQRIRQRMEILEREGIEYRHEYMHSDKNSYGPHVLESLSVPNPQEAWEQFFADSGQQTESGFWTWLACNHPRMFRAGYRNDSSRLFIAFIPEELSKEKDQPFQTPSKLEPREYKLEEKFALLCAIHDAGCPGQERIWDIRQHALRLPESSSQVVDNEWTLFFYYRSLFDNLEKHDEDDVKRVLRDVEADLWKNSTGSSPKTQDKQSPEIFGSFSADALAAYGGGSFNSSWGSEPTAKGPFVVCDKPKASKPKEPTKVKQKRSTEKGEARAKLIAGLTMHHKYADGGCLNLEPIGNNKLARLAKVRESTASAFFKKQFGGHTKYRAACQDAGTLAGALKAMRGEFTPLQLSRMMGEVFEAGKRSSADE